MEKAIKTRPDHHVSVINTTDDSRYILRNRQEILAYLKQIQQDNALLTITFPDQNHPFITILQKIDELNHRIVFHVPDDPVLNRVF